jgi:hypothetical protein
MSGVWLDRAVYGITDAKELWAVTFPKASPSGESSFMRFNDRAMALVKKCSKESMKRKNWYLVEYGSRVIASSLVDRQKRAWVFRHSRRDKNPQSIDPKSIAGVAEILMVTIHP